MDDISLYSISRLQKAFELTTKRNDYFYVEFGKEPLYTDEPFRTETYAILFLKEGSISLQAGLTCREVFAPAVITISPTVTRTFRKSTEKPVMELLFFTDSFLLETRANIFYLSKYQFFEDNDRHILKLDNGAVNRIAPIFNMIKTSFNVDHANEQVLMRSYSYLLIHEIDAMHKNLGTRSLQSDEHGSAFIKFRNLLTKEFWRHRSVSFYANQLNVTPKYLSELIKKQTGKTAGEWIDRAVILEAKVLLQNKSLGVAQISDKLHFSDQSVFGKFFKSHEGVSPAEYRKSLR
ncbi:helix-turn-helix domain-containing protein [Mucilaginibacter sp.]|uniref:helix-turn-helix domain-containing protein n=1 Tax=Mucilaginibacter sp. TaxID=1882438 RepID=UPI0035BBDD06